jgi:hypothetical protein
MREQVEASRECSSPPCNIREFLRRFARIRRKTASITCLSILISSADAGSSFVQHPFNKRVYILASDLNRNLMTVLRIDNCPRMSAVCVDNLRHTPCLIGISPVVLATVQNQGFRFDVLRIIKQRSRLQGLSRGAGFSLSWNPQWKPPSPIWVAAHTPASHTNQKSKQFLGLMDHAQPRCLPPKPRD